MRFIRNLPTRSVRGEKKSVQIALFATLFLSMGIASCGGGSATNSVVSGASAQSCMTCHNASLANDYSGPGLENPHPFPGADNLLCTTCHGGNPGGSDKLTSHVPPPPEIGDAQNLTNNRTAYFNRLTLTGIDRFPDYTVDGTTYTAIDYLQFINPGDLRVVTEGRSCGACHAPHANVVSGSLLATEAGILSGALYAAGIDNSVPENQGLHEDTAADVAFRAVSNAGANTAIIGAVPRLLEFPVISGFDDIGAGFLRNNDDYDAALLSGDLDANNRVIPDSHLADLYAEQIAFTCGDCHLGSAGANNRAGDFRSSGCTACHMPYSLGGRSGSSDPNVNKFEPLDPDDIEAPERAHVVSHRIQSIAKTLPSGVQIQGIGDLACAGCHQGSNRTVMQYWGIRLDQNQDVRRNNQYPAQPVSYQNTSGDTRLFDPAVGNNTFNGRNRNQYLAFEDYDGDNRDDTPADVHHDAGMGCIDCHGSHDLHGGDVNQANEQILSRMEQAVAIRCESCHGSVDAYAATQAGTTYDGTPANIGVDEEGLPMRHVTVDVDGNYFLKSRLTGNMHFISQTRDVTVDSGKTHPGTGQPIYSEKASYAMGRADGNAATGLGPQQTGGVSAGFSHGDSMDCASCHSSWSNSCIGCHLQGEYNTGNNNFSNITGERIVFREENADFVYQSPVPFQLGISPRNKITTITPNSDAFFSYKDRQNDRSEVFAFSDRNGGGNNTGVAASPSLSHNAMMQHSIRGKVDANNEGPRYCVSCHLTDTGLANFGTDYNNFRTAMAIGDYDSLDFGLLRDHIGSNPGNQINSPLWVHMVAGLGSGLYLFNQNGGPENPLDTNANRVGAGGVAPAADFDAAEVRYDLDRIVFDNGVATGSNTHPMLETGAVLRDGSGNPQIAGPMGSTLVQRLTDPTTGIVLDSWLDADGATQGDASTFVPGP